MILLDASALLALLWGEPGESEVAALLRSNDCATAAPCLSEVVDKLIRRNDVLPEQVLDYLDPLIDASLGIVPVENRIAWQAGEFRAAYYSRGHSDLSLADCLLLAAAGSNDKLATADGALAGVASTLEISVIPLPDSKGNRPEVD